MNHKRDIKTGDVFGRLTVIKEVESRIWKTKTVRQWFCKCECGKTKIVTQRSLIQNRSCGCLGKERTREVTFKGYNEISGSLWGTIKKHARYRKIDFNLDIKETWNLFIKQNQTCALSGVKLIMPNPQRHGKIKCGTFREGNASLDRINSSKGYTIDNVQWVDKYINRAKQDLSDEEFIELCRRVVNYQDSKNGVNKDVSTN